MEEKNNSNAASLEGCTLHGLLLLRTWHIVFTSIHEGLSHIRSFKDMVRLLLLAITSELTIWLSNDDRYVFGGFWSLNLRGGGKSHRYFLYPISDLYQILSKCSLLQY